MLVFKKQEGDADVVDLASSFPADLLHDWEGVW